MLIIFKSYRPKRAGVGRYMVLPCGVPRKPDGLPWMWDVVQGYCRRYFAKFGCKAVGVDLDMEMFHPSPLHPMVAVANVFDLPFHIPYF